MTTGTKTETDVDMDMDMGKMVSSVRKLYTA